LVNSGAPERLAVHAPLVTSKTHWWTLVYQKD